MLFIKIYYIKCFIKKGSVKRFIDKKTDNFPQCA